MFFHTLRTEPIAPEKNPGFRVLWSVFLKKEKATKISSLFKKFL